MQQSRRPSGPARAMCAVVGTARVTALGGVLAAACSGTIGGSTSPGAADRSGNQNNPGGSPNGGSSSSAQQSPGAGAGAALSASDMAPARVRRLSVVELRNSLRDVFLGGATAPGFDYAPPRHEFDNNIDALLVDETFGESLQPVAEQTGSAVSGNLSALLPCSVGITTANEPSCAATFIATFGPRAFRRPLTGDESDALNALFKDARTRVNFNSAIGIVVEGLVQSPKFLFRTELGAPSKTAGVVSLTPYEIASALSYFIWRSSPDDSLLQAAANGQLATSAQIQAQAQRLMQDDRATAMFADFVSQWSETNLLGGGLSKGDAAFTPTLAAAMLDESTRYASAIFKSSTASFASLMTSTSTYANAATAAIYGISGPKDATMQPVTLDGTKRMGFLTQPAFMVAQSSPGSFSPIFPGLFIRRKVLCQTLPDPPANVPQPSIDPSLSTRQRFAEHESNAFCGACHKLIDPIGFGFEHLDELGRYRDSENANGVQIPLTGEGTLTNTDTDGSFVGVAALAKRLAASAEAGSCFSAQLMKFMLGRDAAMVDTRLAIDNRSLAALGDGAASIHDIIAGLVVSDSFLLRDGRSLPGGGQ